MYLDKHWRPSVYKMINHQTGKSTDLLVQNIKFKLEYKYISVHTGPVYTINPKHLITLI